MPATQSDPPAADSAIVSNFAPSKKHFLRFGGGAAMVGQNIPCVNQLPDKELPIWLSGRHSICINRARWGTLNT